MTDVVVHRLEVLIRELTAERHDVDPPDDDAYRTLMAAIERNALNMPKQDLVRLQTLAERRTGVRK